MYYILHHVEHIEESYPLPPWRIGSSRIDEGNRSGEGSRSEVGLGKGVRSEVGLGKGSRSEEGSRSGRGSRSEEAESWEVGVGVEEEDMGKKKVV